MGTIKRIIVGTVLIVLGLYLFFGGPEAVGLQSTGPMGLGALTALSGAISGFLGLIILFGSKTKR